MLLYKKALRNQKKVPYDLLVPQKWFSDQRGMRSDFFLAIFIFFIYYIRSFYSSYISHMNAPVKNYAEESLAFHAKNHGKLETISKAPIVTREDLSLAYTP